MAYPSSSRKQQPVDLLSVVFYFRCDRDCGLDWVPDLCALAALKGAVLNARIGWRLLVPDLSHRPYYNFHRVLIVVPVNSTLPSGLVAHSSPSPAKNEQQRASVTERRNRAPACTQGRLPCAAL